MTPEQLVKLMAQTVAGMGVPISLGMPLGTADTPLRELMGLAPGWASADEYETEFRNILNLTP